MHRPIARSFTPLVVLAVLFGSRPAFAADLAGKRPNIVLVMTDDQGKGDLSCLGNDVIETPNLDRFHALSTRLRDFHVSPTCAPTRSAIMSGRHEFQNGVTHTILERERMSLETRTMPDMLRKAGYTTAIFGKWHLGDEREYQPDRRGFDEAFIHGAGGIGQAYDCSCADAPPNQQNKYFDVVVRHNGTFKQTEGFCTDVFFDAALGWIKEKHEADEPFFAYVSTNAPHGPMIAPEKYKQPLLDAGWDANTAGRYGMIVNIDDNFGRMMKKFDEWGVWDDTLVIFMTDNGQAGRRGRRNGKPVALPAGGLKNGKGSPNEGGTRVPAFWRWKGVLPEGRDVDALAAHIDLFPTFAALTGGELPNNGQVKGRSLLPILEDADAKWEDRFLFTHKGRWPTGADVHEHEFNSCAVRTARFRLVNNAELYDIAADPGETKNVIADHPEQVARMRAAYDAWWRETVPLMVNEKAPMSKTRPFWVEYERQKSQAGIPKWTRPEI